MLFSEDLIFENFNNFTKYYPNKKFYQKHIIIRMTTL